MTMKPLMLVGVVLTALGIVALVFASGIRYSSREKLPHDGDTQVISKQEKIVSVPPALAGLALAGGFGLMLVASRK